MRTRWLAVGVLLAAVGVANAQPAQPSTASKVLSEPLPPGAKPPSPAAQGQPLPLLPVPQVEPPLAEVPRPGAVPGVEYDHGYQYLPDRLPDRRYSVDDLCGPPGRWWVSTSLELAWVPTRPLPTNIRLRLPDPVSLGGTLPGPVLHTAGRDAGRFEAALGLVLGHWFGETNTHGVEASFFLRDTGTTFGAVAPDTIVIFPRGRGRGAPQLVALPDPFALSVVSTFPVTLETFFTTVDVNYRRKLYCDENGRLDALVGYRYAFLSDELYLGEFADDGDGYRQNRAAVSNNFHGGQVGLAGEYRANGWFVAGSAKLAFGATTAEVTTSGAFVSAEGRASGSFRRLNGLTWNEESVFAVMPAFNVQVGRQITPHARIFTGYSFMYLSRAARLGDAASPFNGGGITFTDFWVQSISLGAEFRF